MNYPELGKLEATDDQDLGLNIAFKTAANAGSTRATTAGEYLAERVRDLLSGYEGQHVTDERRARIQDAVDAALSSGDATAVAGLASALNVDLDVALPADAIVSDAVEK